MVSASWVPLCFAGYDASDIAWVVPVPGLTGLAITSRRSYNLIEPIDRLDLISASVSHLLRNLRCKVRSMTRLIGFAARHDSPHHAGHLVCHSYARQTRWLPGEQREEARIRSLGLMPCPSDQRGRADHQELSEIPVAHLGDVPETVLSAARVLRRCQPEPGGKLSTRAELTRISNRGRQRCGTDRANARYGR